MFRSLGSALVSVLAYNPFSSVHVQDPSAPVVDLGYALYQGTFNGTSNTTNFLGIRYAAPPLGNLRFQAPAPPLNQTSLGVQMADTLSAGCPQADAGHNFTTPFRNGTGMNVKRRQSATEPEDCLFLNVFVSGTLDPSAKMPVVVWIHGGGYVGLNTVGQSGENLISEAGGGLVVVNMDYRLGVFGFLPGAEVKQKGALNAGLLDQQAVLQWVQNFIPLFGGDPSQVTIWGESAGAGSVMQHMIAHGGNTQPPLFNQAITSSTFLPSQYKFDDPIPEQIFSEFVQMTGCSDATDAFECLVNVDEATLESVNVAINLSGFEGTYVLVPVIDGDLIIESPTATILKGTLNGEKLLTVTNTLEGSIFVNANFSAEMTVTDYVTRLFPGFNATTINDTVAQYTSIGLNTVNDQAIRIMGESIFICPTYLLLQSFQGPSFKGEFAIPPGAHGDDVFFYFPDAGAPDFNNTQFQASFAGAFTGFAKFGDPNVHPVSEVITPTWDLFNTSNTEMLFNRTEDGQPDIRAITTDAGLLERCSFWRSVAPFAAQ